MGSLELGWILTAGWIIAQIPLFRLICRSTPIINRYPFRTRIMLFVPFARSWASSILPEDIEFVRRYRALLLRYYFGLFLLPLALFFLALYVTS